MASSRRSPVVALLAALVFGAPMCVPDPVDPGDDGGVSDDGTPGRTHVETLWPTDSRPPVVTILSGCGALYPDPSLLVMTCDAFDFGPHHSPTPRTTLEYSYVLYPVFGMGDCPDFWVGESEWERFPQDGTPVELVFEDPAGRALPCTASGDRACEWFFSFAVRDPSGNVGSAACRVMILR